MNTCTKGYIAGKLFKQGDIRQRLYEGELVKSELPHIAFYNPIENGGINDKSNLPTAQDIFHGDLTKILESDYVVAELDDEDSGTMYELGICHGIEILRAEIAKHADKDIDCKELLALVDKSVPKKMVFAHLSDIRLPDAHMYKGKYVPQGINQFVVGGVEEIGRIYPSIEGIVNDLKKL